MMEQGLLHLYWGDGKGKTTAAMGLCPPRTGQRQTGCHRAVPQGRAERRDPSAGPAGQKIFRGKGGQKFVFQMNEAEKAAARAVQNENLTAALVEPADLLILDEAGSAWELDMVDKDLLRRAVLERPRRAGMRADRPQGPAVDAGCRRLLHRDEMLPPPLPEGHQGAQRHRILKNARRTAAFSGPPGFFVFTVLQ